MKLFERFRRRDGGTAATDPGSLAIDAVVTGNLVRDRDDPIHFPEYVRPRCAPRRPATRPRGMPFRGRPFPDSSTKAEPSTFGPESPRRLVAQRQGFVLESQRLDQPAMPFLLRLLAPARVVRGKTTL